MAMQFVKDVSAGQFDQEVIERSRSVTVVVDFWAEWCGPCRMLGPILERLAEEFSGAFELAKVNTDENYELSSSFGIRSIPNVKVFRGGKVVGEMAGALPEAQVRQFLQSHCPSEAGKLVAQADEAEKSGDVEEARRALILAVEKDPRHGAALVRLARLEMKAGSIEAALSYADAVPLGSAEYDVAGTLRAEIEFHRTCAAAKGLEAARLSAGRNPEDLDAMFAFASCLAAEGRHEEALGQFLEIVRRDKSYQDEAARKAMLTIFSLIGERDPLMDEYRRRLATALF